VPLGHGATPAEIAAGVLFILSSPSMTGQMIALAGGEHLGCSNPERALCRANSAAGGFMPANNKWANSGYEN